MNRDLENPNVLSLESEMSDMNITPPPSPPSSNPVSVTDPACEDNTYSHTHDTATASADTDYKVKESINDVEMQTNKMNMVGSPTIARDSSTQDIRSPTRNERNRVQPQYIRRTPTRAVANTSNVSTISAASKITISSPARCPDQGYHFFRTHSSPSVIDYSPKPSSQEPLTIMSSTPSSSPFFRDGRLGMRTGPGIGMHKSELTPVMRNTNLDEEIGGTSASGSKHPTNTNHNNSSNSNNNINNGDLNSLAFPETNFFVNNLTRRDTADINDVGAMDSSSSQMHQQHRHPIDGINRNPVNIRPRNTPNDHDLNLDPPSISTKRLVSPLSFREALCIPPPPPPPIPSSMALNGTEIMDEGVGREGQRYVSPPSRTLLTQPIPLGRNCHSLTSPNEYGWRHGQQTQQQPIAGEGYAVPPSSPTSPSQDGVGGDAPNNHLSPQEYMVPYQPSRDSSLASYGVVTDDVDGIFLAPRRRRKQRQQARACGRRENSCGEVDDEDDDDDERMEAWDRDRSVGGGEDDGSIASSSIPSIRMAVRLNSSTITHEEQDDGSFFDTYDRGHIMFDSDNDGDEQQQYTVHHLQRQYHQPLDMAVTPSPPRRTFRIPSNREGGEMTGKIHNEALEWLKTVEVGRNNQYVAEAASSKFLTGKQTHPATDPSNISNNLMNGSGGGRGGGMMTNGYDMGKRVHSTGTQNPNIMMFTGRQPISSSKSIASVTGQLKGKGCAPSVSVPVSTTSTSTTRTNGLATSGTAGTSNTRRSQQVMGRSMNMFHGPGRGVRRGGRGSNGVSRTRASAVMR